MFTLHTDGTFYYEQDLGLAHAKFYEVIFTKAGNNYFILWIKLSNVMMLLLNETEGTYAVMIIYHWVEIPISF